MQRIAKFEKVSQAQFIRDWMDTFASTEADAVAVYQKIRLPERPLPVRLDTIFLLLSPLP